MHPYKAICGLTTARKAIITDLCQVKYQWQTVTGNHRIPSRAVLFNFQTQKMHSVIDRIDLKENNNKRGNRSQPFCGQWLLDITLYKRYHNWPFGGLNIYKHFPAQSLMFPLNTSFHSFIAIFPRRFLLRKKSSVRDWLFLSILHTEPAWQKHWAANSWSACFSLQNQIFYSSFPE